MRTDVRNYVRRCKICQQAKIPPGKPLGLMGERHLPKKPFEIIATDLIGPLPRTTKGFKYICMVTDVFSKYVIVKPIRDAKSKTVASVIESEVFLTYGVPSKILCDNGPEYRGAPFKSLAEEYGVKIFYNARRHPQANPAERYNRTLITMLRAYVKDEQKKWDALLPKLTVALRTAVSQTTGFSPASLVFLFGYEMQPNLSQIANAGPNDLLHPLQKVNEKKTSLSTLVEKVHQKMKQAAGKNKALYDLRRKNLEFEVGEWVWKKNFAQSSAADAIAGKLCKRFTGPFRIVKKTSPVVYQLCNHDGDDVGVWHISDLKPYFDTSEEFHP